MPAPGGTAVRVRDHGAERHWAALSGRAVRPPGRLPHPCRSYRGLVSRVVFITGPSGSGRAPWRRTWRSGGRRPACC
jgi:hypothetical protein